MKRVEIFRVIALLAVCVGFPMVGAGCVDPKCPRGYSQTGDTCYRIKDGGQDAGDPDEDGEDGGLEREVHPASPQLDASSPAASRDASNEMERDAAVTALPDGGDPASDATYSGGEAGIALPVQDANASFPVSDASGMARPCDSNPCQNGGTCSPDGGGYSCACLNGYTGMTCELEICNATPIRSRADVENNRLCAEIRGNLDISSAGLTEIRADDFPFLTKVTGDLLISGLHTGSPPFLQSVTLSKLQAVEGMVMITSVAVAGTSQGGPLAELRLPALTTIGNRQGAGLIVSQAALKVLELPVLTTVRGSVTFSGLFELCTLDIAKVTRVEGEVKLGPVWKLSAKLFDQLRSAALGPATQFEVGCCWMNNADKASCETFLSDNRVYCTAC